MLGCHQWIKVTVLNLQPLCGNTRIPGREFSRVSESTVYHISYWLFQAQDMGGAGLGLQGAVGRFRKVMEEPQQRKMFFIVTSTVAVLFVLYLLSSRWKG